MPRFSRFSTVLLVLSASSLVAACATEPVATAPRDPHAQVCTREYPTGSNMPVTRCRTQEQIDRERRDSQRSLDELDRSRPRSAGPPTN